jgi:hypothetical protein
MHRTVASMPSTVQAVNLPILSDGLVGSTALPFRSVIWQGLRVSPYGLKRIPRRTVTRSQDCQAFRDLLPRYTMNVCEAELLIPLLVGADRHVDCKEQPGCVGN